MKIRHNISVLNTANRLRQNNLILNKSLEKLSSGYKVNRASDDSAGLAISEKMRGQIRGLNMASKNIQDGISLIQTAEGALNEIQALLQRGRELFVQASNGTNVTDDRKAIQMEIDEIKKEITNIGNTTEFNTKKLLNGGLSSSNLVTTTVDKQIQLQTQNDEQIMIYTFFKEPAINDAFGISGSVGGGGYLNFQFNPSTVYDYVPLGNSGDESLDNIIAKFNDIKSNGSVNKRKLINDYDIRIERQGNTILLYSKTNVSYLAGVNQSYNSQIVNPNQNYTLNIKENVKVLNTNTSNSHLTLQIGANSNQTLTIELLDISSEKLDIDNVSVLDHSSAQNAITSFDNAITKVSTVRSNLGAFQNRLEHTYNSVTNTAENLTSAESRIRDTDIAKEMMKFTKQNILMNATQSMLSQANQQPQWILQLLN